MLLKYNINTSCSLNYMWQFCKFLFYSTDCWNEIPSLKQKVDAFLASPALIIMHCISLLSSSVTTAWLWICRVRTVQLCLMILHSLVLYWLLNETCKGGSEKIHCVDVLVLHQHSWDSAFRTDRNNWCTVFSYFGWAYLGKPPEKKTVSVKLKIIAAWLHFLTSKCWHSNWTNHILSYLAKVSQTFFLFTFTKP